MGLFDSVLGAVTGGQPAQSGNSNVGGMGGSTGLGGLGGLGGLLGMVTSNPQLMQAVTGMLGNDGAHGGLGGLVGKFEQAGLGGMVSSWIGSGENHPVSGEQITDVFGPDAIAGMAQKMGVSPTDAAGQLSNVLPGLIDKLTPHGETPAGGLGNSGDLIGMLSGLLQKR